MTSIYDYDQRLAASKRNIKLLRNGEVSLRFLDHLGALGLSTARVSKYACHLPVLLRAMDFDLKDAARSDFEKVVAGINSGPFKEWTKHDKKLVIRKLLQYERQGKCDRDTPFPPEVSWIKLRFNKDKDNRTTPESLLTPEDFIAMVRATQNRRDRAMIYVLFEAALRPGELLTMSVDSVAFKDEYCLIAVNGKTGIKRIPLVVSVKPLLEWLQDYPEKDNPKAPLWPSLSPHRTAGNLSYRHFRYLIKKIGKKAHLKKDVWPYLYRHTTLTAMAKVFTEAKLEQFAGWTYGSSMTRRYVHFSARDLEDAVLELHGLREVKKDRDIAKIIECPRCKTKNPMGSVRCNLCGMFIDKETAFKFEEAEHLKNGDLQVKNEELTMRLEKLENVISALLTSQGEANIR